MSVSEFVKYHVILQVTPSFLIELLQHILVSTPIIFGDKTRLHIHPSVVTMNTLFNLSSGDIWVDKETMFSHNVMVLTGKHEMSFLGDTMYEHTVPSGRDIRIGKQCMIYSGAIILGGVTIGDRSVIAAGSIVTKYVPEGSVIKGVY